MTPAVFTAGRVRHRTEDLSRSLRLKAAGLARATRAAMAGVGLPIRKEFLVVGCAEGEDASGLFSEVAAVIGALEHYERWSRVYAGLRVDFTDQGLYHDPAAGDNWWEYYFEPIRIGSADCAVTRVVESAEHDAFADEVEERMSRATAAALVDRHVRIKSYLTEGVDRFVRETFTGDGVIGIHYRGTDKSDETAPVPYETMAVAVRDVLHAAGTDRCQIFLATDEQAFLDYMLGLFPGKVLYRQMPRSVDGTPIHKRPGHGFRKGEDAAMDCLVLSRCTQLVRTDSDLGLFAALFNPALPVRLLRVHK